MNSALNGNKLSQYQQIKRVGGVTDADPHKLVLMLLDGALSKLATVKGLMLRKDTQNKGELIGQTVAIVSGLRSSINMDKGGEIATNLDNIYEYMERQLIKSNLENDVSIIEEVSSLLHEIKSGWDSIPDKYKVDVLPTLSVVP